MQEYRQSKGISFENKVFGMKIGSLVSYQKYSIVVAALVESSTSTQSFFFHH